MTFLPPSLPITIWRTMRPAFLLLTPVNLLLALASARLSVDDFSAISLWLLLFAALLAHISVNMLNEYHDYVSTLDAHTQRTPFSGGSGALQQHPALAPAIVTLGLICLAVATVIGGYLAWRTGWQLLLPGVVGIMLVVAYTPVITRLPWLCLLAPGTGFGPVMILGSHWVLAGHYSAAAGYCAMVSFFLVNNLLLLNQFPDIDADRRVGRRHLPILWGEHRCGRLFEAFLVLAFASLIFGVTSGALPPGALLGGITIPLAWAVALGVRRAAEEGSPLQPAMAGNVALALVTPLLIAAGIVLGA